MNLLINATRGAALCCSVCLAGGYVYLQAGGELPTFLNSTQAGETADPLLAQAAPAAAQQQRAVIGGSKSRVPLIPDAAKGNANAAQSYLQAESSQNITGKKFLPGSKYVVVKPSPTILPGSKSAIMVTPPATPLALPPGATVNSTTRPAGKPTFLPGSKSMVLPSSLSTPPLPAAQGQSTTVIPTTLPPGTYPHGTPVILPGSKSSIFVLPPPTQTNSNSAATPQYSTPAPQPSGKRTFLPGSKSLIIAPSSPEQPQQAQAQAQPLTTYIPGSQTLPLLPTNQVQASAAPAWGSSNAVPPPVQKPQSAPPAKSKAKQK